MNDAGTAEAGLDPRALASATRAEAARSYLLRWRPIVATTFLVLTVALTVAFPDSARPAVVLAIAAITVASWSAVGAVVLGVEALAVAFVLTLVDVPLVSAWAIATHSSTGEGMSALAAIVLVAAWLLGPRIAAAVGALSCAAILGAWFLHERWADQQVLPDVAWVVVASTVLSVAISLDRDRALHAVGRAARESVDAMRDVVQLRRRLVADVSHELRTPLTAINGVPDPVLDDDLELDGSMARDLLREARRGGDRLERLVTQLLVVERAEAGELVLAPRPVAATRVLGAAVRAVPVPINRSVRIAFTTDDARHAVLSVDESRAIDMVANLVRNALEHGEGEVLLEAALLGPVFRLDVRDEGPGLQLGTERHAFEPFATFGHHLGSAGLGLATARAFALAHDGSLDYVPDRGDGRHAFRLLLPVTPPID